MSEKHLSAQFDAELNHISSMVMEMGGLVEHQLRQAVEAMTDYDLEIAKQVLDTEPRVLTPVQLRTLELLARQTVMLLDARMRDEAARQP